MKHTAFRNGQKTPDARGGNLPEMNLNLQIFIPNQSHSLILPVVSDMQKLMWVYSNQAELPLNSVIELSKTFDRFPYLTQKETNALAQRCSLHPDQVKVWFMVQRLRFGISWDFKDIQGVRSKLKSNQGNEELQEKTKEEGTADSGKKKTRKRKVGVTDGEKMEEKCKKKRSLNQEGNERKINLEQLVKREKKVEENKKDTQKKQKKVTETGDMGEERMTQGDGVLEETETQMFVQFTGAELEGRLHAMSINLNHAVTDVDKLRKLIEGTEYPTTESKPVLPKPRCQFRTLTQLGMMRKAFLQCQYPGNKDYSQLSALIGINRSQLVQWYCDTRYHIKRGHPRWLSQEQHRDLLANIRIRQFLKSVVKMKPIKRNKRIEWEKILVEGASCGKTE